MDENVVVQLLILIKKLISLKENCVGSHLFEPANSYHPYKDYSALRNYLALTCFDILGQPSPFLTFQNWLEAKSEKIIDERNAIFNLYSGEMSKEKTQSIYKAYSDIYGVRNSFFRFIREIISESNRLKLYDSVVVLRKPTVDEIKIYSIDSTQGIEFDPGSVEKDKFLYRVRNNFTHQGISNSSFIGGIVDWINIDIPTINNGEELWALEDAEDPSKENKHCLYQHRRWPLILIEIIRWSGFVIPSFELRIFNPSI